MADNVVQFPGVRVAPALGNDERSVPVKVNVDDPKKAQALMNTLAGYSRGFIDKEPA